MYMYCYWCFLLFSPEKPILQLCTALMSSIHRKLKQMCFCTIQISYWSTGSWLFACLGSGLANIFEAHYCLYIKEVDDSAIEGIFLEQGLIIQLSCITQKRLCLSSVIIGESGHRWVRVGGGGVRVGRGWLNALQIGPFKNAISRRKKVFSSTS